MKNENDLTKLARWIIPGWILILSFASFVIIDIEFNSSGKIRLYASIQDFLDAVFNSNDVLSAIIIAVAGVPLGFTIYQLYFYLRWNSPFSKDGLISPFLPGRMVDMAGSTRDITKSELTRDRSWRKTWVDDSLYELEHSFRWQYIELLFTEAAQVIDSQYDQVSIYTRHRYLHEVMHTLGASIGAVYVGYIGYLFLLYHKISKIYLPTYLLIIFLLLFILFHLLHVEEKARRHEIRMPQNGAEEQPRQGIKFPLPWKKNREAVIMYPGALFFLFIVMLHFFGNPLFTKTSDWTDLTGRIVVLLVVAFIWIKSKKKPKREVVIGDQIFFLFLTILTISFGILRDQFFAWIDWAFFSTTTIFLAANMILFQNRQNAKEDMLALEYYTLRRFLEECQSIETKVKRENN